MRSRRGRQFYPDLCDVVDAGASEILSRLETVAAWDAVIDAEPALAVTLTGDRFDCALLAIAGFVDLKSPYTRRVSAISRRRRRSDSGCQSSRRPCAAPGHGPVEDRHEDVDGTTIQFLTIRENVDASPLLKGLPGDRCPCPHWGYVFKGRLRFRFANHEETYEAGDAFYLQGGHVPSAEPGTEYLQFSPAHELHEVSETIMRNFQALQHA